MSKFDLLAAVARGQAFANLAAQDWEAFRAWIAAVDTDRETLAARVAALEVAGPVGSLPTAAEVTFRWGAAPTVPNQPPPTAPNQPLPNEAPWTPLPIAEGLESIGTIYNISAAAGGSTLDQPYTVNPGLVRGGVINRGCVVDFGGSVISGSVQRKAPIVITTSEPVVLRNFFVAGTDDTDSSGACIRDNGQPLNLRLENFVLGGMSNGILTSGGGVIGLENFVIEALGDDKGFAHGVYFGRHDLVHMINGSLPGGTLDRVLGHSIKSRAALTILEGLLVDQGTRRMNRCVDISNGGEVEIMNGRFVQTTRPENKDFIACGPETTPPIRPNKVTIKGCDITFQPGGAFGFLRPDQANVVDISGNTLRGTAAWAGWRGFPELSVGNAMMP